MTFHDHQDKVTHFVREEWLLGLNRHVMMVRLEAGDVLRYDWREKEMTMEDRIFSTISSFTQTLETEFDVLDQLRLPAKPVRYYWRAHWLGQPILVKRS